MKRSGRRLSLLDLRVAFVLLCVVSTTLTNIGVGHAAKLTEPGDAGCGSLAPGAAPTADPLSASSEDASTRDLLSGLKLMNYFPADRGWYLMWTQWDSGVVDADFARIAALGGNGVRLVLHAETIGYPEPSATMLDRLAELVDLAARHGLVVQLTLFDGWSDYTNLAGSTSWADAVLSPYKDDPRIVFIELQNEIDSSNSDAMIWAKFMVPSIKSIAGNIPVTLSSSGAVGLTGIERIIAASIPVDFYDLHYYDKAELAYTTFQSAMTMVGNKPLFIGETGYSTALTASRATMLYDQEWWESYQDQYHRTVQCAARVLGLPAPAPWIFSDFHEQDDQPLDIGEQFYGIYRADGTPKEAVHTFGNIFGQTYIDTSFNNGFELATSSGLLTNWKRWEPQSGSFARDITVAHSGVASGKISNSSGTSSGLPAFYLSPIPPIVPGQMYTASVWARGSNATGMTRLMLAWFDVHGEWLGNLSSADLPGGSTDWTQLQVMDQAPLSARFAEIHLVSAWNDGAAWFDDVWFD